MPTIEQAVNNTRALMSNPGEHWVTVPQGNPPTSVEGSPALTLSGILNLPVRSVYPNEFTTAADFLDSADVPGTFRTRVLQSPTSLILQKTT